MLITLGYLFSLWYMGWMLFSIVAGLGYVLYLLMNRKGKKDDEG